MGQTPPRGTRAMHRSARRACSNNRLPIRKAIYMNEFRFDTEFYPALKNISGNRLVSIETVGRALTIAHNRMYSGEGFRPP